MTTDLNKLKLETLNYDSYLKIPDLLDLQNQITDPPHHDEMFFIIIHQASELWFKLMIHESNILIKAFQENQISKILKVLKRITVAMDLMVSQVNLLSTLTPVEFSGFRDHLKPASGFQSSQFREIEFVFGLREKFFLKFFKSIPHVVENLDSILKQPSVYDEFVSLLHRMGYDVPRDLLERDYSYSHTPHDEFVETLKGIYEKPGDNYHLILLFERMMDFDEKLTLWRTVHLTMVARTIGFKQGTGGSAGFEFLMSRAFVHIFPDLWEVRNHIGKSNY